MSEGIAPRWANVPIAVLSFALVRCATRCFDFPSVLRLVLQRKSTGFVFGKLGVLRKQALELVGREFLAQ
jgi:hypothetical protein